MPLSLPIAADIAWTSKPRKRAPPAQPVPLGLRHMSPEKPAFSAMPMNNRPLPFGTLAEKSFRSILIPLAYSGIRTWPSASGWSIGPCQSPPTLWSGIQMRGGAAIRGTAMSSAAVERNHRRVQRSERRRDMIDLPRRGGNLRVVELRYKAEEPVGSCRPARTLAFRSGGVGAPCAVKLRGIGHNRKI